MTITATAVSITARPNSLLVDTGILLRWLDTANPLLQQRIADTFAGRTADGDMLHVTPQNLIEMWNVATRPASGNGFGLTPGQADTLITRVLQAFVLLPETPDVFPVWRDLAARAGVSGKQVHDTRLVAFMVVHGVGEVLTLNAGDFRRFETMAGIVVVEP